MGERRGTKGLELWCRRMTEGYPGVEVNNMTTSWRNGLAFCAIIHHFRPDLIDFAKLNKDDIFYNNDLAFQLAERHLGIPALLEPEDMVQCPVPDRLSILTYLSQFYQTFVVAHGSPSRIVPKRPANASERGVVTPTSASPASKAFKVGGGRFRREPCAKCGLPVFIAERLNVGKQLYHRTCFRCARCDSQLTLANYYETEHENQFCCETCPDEEAVAALPKDDKLPTRSLSDEEKSAGLQKYDNYSCMFETALENSSDGDLLKNGTLSDKSPDFMNARSLFFTSQLDDGGGENDTSEDETPDLPKSEPPNLSENEPPDLPAKGRSENTDEDINIILKSELCESCVSDFPTDAEIVHSNFSDASDNLNQLETAADQLDANIIVTKEEEEDTALSDNSNDTSLVKARMRLFETQSPDKQIQNSPKKLIRIVPLENQSPTRLENNIFDLTKVESDNASTSSNSRKSSLDVDNINNESHTNQEEEDTSSMAKQDNSIIIISDTSKETDSSKENYPNSARNDDPSSILTISDMSTSETSQKDQEKYPEDLNPFSDQEEDDHEGSPKIPKPSLNPFDDDEDDDEVEEIRPSPRPAARRHIAPVKTDLQIAGKNEQTPEHLQKIRTQRESFNPYDVMYRKDLKSTGARAHTINASAVPTISLNPFWSDGEDPDDKKEKPVPLPRNYRSTFGTPEPKPRKIGLAVATSLMYGSNTSLSSSYSGSGPSSGRKKKPAPKPPAATPDSAQSSLASSPSQSVQHSPKLTARARKSKKAPAPPSISSTPINMATMELCSIHAEVSPIISQVEEEEIPPSPNKVGDPPEDDQKGRDEGLTDADECEKEKIIKDELNRNRQSQIITSPISSSENSSSLPIPNKSTYGKWKRRKGPAPSRPIPQRRNIKPLPVVEIKRELEFIEIQQQGLEKQGVRLEQIIREKCEGPNAELDMTLPPEIEDMVLQLFELVNEKNELFRKQTELMYLRRQQRLEEEYVDLEYQIRCLMMQPEANKTDTDKAREEELINRLVEVVERRNEIVECLEMDRVREAEEDVSIYNHLNIYALKRDEDSGCKSTPDEVKQKKKEKKFKFKSSKKMDIDKDIDECESSGGVSSPAKTKDKKKKKFNIF